MRNLSDIRCMIRRRIYIHTLCEHLKYKKDIKVNRWDIQKEIIFILLHHIHPNNCYVPHRKWEEKNEGKKYSAVKHLLPLPIFFILFSFFLFLDDTNIELDRMKILIGWRKKRKQESSCGRHVGRVGWKQTKKKTHKELLTVVLSHNR